MSTKQLNVSTPRNFKEKIELLRRKEAACTANFAAAIRDARKIRQIAGSSTRALRKGDLSSRSDPADSSSQSDSFGKPGHSSNTVESLRLPSANDILVTSPPLTNLTTAIGRARPSKNECRFPPISSLNGLDGFGTLQSDPIAPFKQTRSFRSHACARSLHSVPDYTRCYTSQGLQQQSAKSSILLNTEGVFLSNPTSYKSSFIAHSLSHISMGHLSDRNFNTGPMTTQLPSYANDCGSCVSLSSASIQFDPQNQSVRHSMPTQRIPYLSYPTTPSCNHQRYNGPTSSRFFKQCVSQNFGAVEHSSQSSTLSQIGTGGDGRRVSSDSSIRHSLLTSKLLSQRTDSCLVSFSSTGRKNHSNQVQGNFVNHEYQVSPPYFLCSTASKTPYQGQDEHTIPLKRPHTLCTPVPQTSVVITEDRQQMEFQNPTTALSGNKMNPIYGLSDCPFTTSDHHSSGLWSRSDVTQKLSGVLSSSAPNINIHTDRNTCDVVHSKIGPMFSFAESFTGDLSSSAVDQADLDRYLQIPGAFLDGEDADNLVGRRDSCTMTAEVLSALSVTTCSKSATPCVNPCDNKFISAIPPLIAPSFTSGSQTELETSMFSDQLYDLSGSGHAYHASPVGLFTPNTAGEPLITTTTHAPTCTTASCMQVVASKLGISINSSDYQLLTDPHLSTYVTDETTEAQLLI